MIRGANVKKRLFYPKTRMATIDVSPKQSITIEPIRELSIAETKNELDHIKNQSALIRKKYYSNNIALEQVQSENFIKLCFKQFEQPAEIKAPKLIKLGFRHKKP